MKIEVNIEEQLEQIWNEIGLSGQEIEDNYTELNQRVQNLFMEYLREQLKRRKHLLAEVEAKETEVEQIVHQFALKGTKPLDKSLSLKQRLRESQLREVKLKAETAKQREAIESLYEKLVACFEILEVEDRGDYETLGTDFSDRRKQHMTAFLDRMQEDIDERRPQKQELLSEIHKLQDILHVPVEEDDGKLGDQTFDRLEAEKVSLASRIEKNKKKIRRLYKHIQQLEAALHGRITTQPDYDNISDYKVTQLHNKLKQLDGEKEVKTPEYIGYLKRRLLELWKEMHMKVPTKSQCPHAYSEEPNKRTLLALENEVFRLEALKTQIDPMLRLLEEREQVLKEYEDTERESQMLRMSRASKPSMRDAEKARRQYLTRLPKINKELIAKLEQYQRDYGEPLIWDGEDLLQTIRKAQAASEIGGYETSERARTMHELDRRALRSPPRTPK